MAPMSDPAGNMSKPYRDIPHLQSRPQWPGNSMPQSAGSECPLQSSVRHHIRHDPNPPHEQRWLNWSGSYRRSVRTTRFVQDNKPKVLIEQSLVHFMFPGSDLRSMITTLLKQTTRWL
jgi:hypothetical protein